MVIEWLWGILSFTIVSITSRAAKAPIDPLLTSHSYVVSKCDPIIIDESKKLPLSVA